MRRRLAVVVVVASLAVAGLVTVRPATASVARSWGAVLTGPDGAVAGSVQVTVNPVTSRVCADAAVYAVEPVGIVVRSGGLDLPVAGLSSERPLLGCTTDPATAQAVLGGTAQAVAVDAATPTGFASGALRVVVAAERPFAVGTGTFTTRDGSRTTVRRRGGRLVALAGRTLVTRVLYPAVGVAGPADHAHAEPGVGPYPVVVFAHGYDVTPAFYERTLHAFAQAGYVVLAPEFPGSTSAGRCCATEADLGQQPRDLSRVLDAATRLGADPDSFLGGLLDLDHVAAVGHSDGGTTVAGLVEDPRLRDRRIDAAIVLSGGRLTDRPTTGRTVPTLLMAGERDEYNPQSVFGHVFAALTGPRLWVAAVRGSHAGPFTSGTPQAAVLRRLEVAFLDLELKGRPTRSVIRSLRSLPGVTRLKGGGL